MPFYLSILSVIFLIFAIWLALVYFLAGKNVTYDLFIEALKQENSGYLEEAVITYEIALCEVKKTRFHSGLENRILAKLKLMHTLIEYQKGFRFRRQK